MAAGTVVPCLQELMMVAGGLPGGGLGATAVSEATSPSLRAKESESEDSRRGGLRLRDAADDGRRRSAPINRYISILVSCLFS
jgi:hypothetical protein